MSILVALAVAMIAWSVRRVAQGPLAIMFAGSAVALAAGAALGLALYPWTDLPVLGFAVAGGVLVGRRLAPRPMPMLVFLAVLAALDAIQIIAPGPGPGPGATGSAAPAWYFYGMLVIDTAWSHTRVGIFDVLLIAAMVEHARRRGLPFGVGAAPGVLAFVAAGAAVLVFGPLNLPLVPFLFAGWLATGIVVRITGMPSQSERKPTAR